MLLPTLLTLLSTYVALRTDSEDANLLHVADADDDRGEGFESKGSDSLGPTAAADDHGEGFESKGSPGPICVFKESDNFAPGIEAMVIKIDLGTACYHTSNCNFFRFLEGGRQKWTTYSHTSNGLMGTLAKDSTYAENKMLEKIIRYKEQTIKVGHMKKCLCYDATESHNKELVRFFTRSEYPCDAWSCWNMYLTFLSKARALDYTSFNRGAWQRPQCEAGKGSSTSGMESQWDVVRKVKDNPGEHKNLKKRVGPLFSTKLPLFSPADIKFLTLKETVEESEKAQLNIAKQFALSFPIAENLRNFFVELPETTSTQNNFIVPLFGTTQHTVVYEPDRKHEAKQHIEELEIALGLINEMLREEHSNVNALDVLTDVDNSSSFGNLTDALAPIVAEALEHQENTIDQLVQAVIKLDVARSQVLEEQNWIEAKTTAENSLTFINNMKTEFEKSYWKIVAALKKLESM